MFSVLRCVSIASRTFVWVGPVLWSVTPKNSVFLSDSHRFWSDLQESLTRKAKWKKLMTSIFKLVQSTSEKFIKLSFFRQLLVNYLRNVLDKNCQFSWQAVSIFHNISTTTKYSSIKIHIPFCLVYMSNDIQTSKLKGSHIIDRQHIIIITTRQHRCVCLFKGGGPMWPLPMMLWISQYKDPHPWSRSIPANMGPNCTGTHPALGPQSCTNLFNFDLTGTHGPVLQTCSLWSTYRRQASSSPPTGMLFCCCCHHIHNHHHRDSRHHHHYWGSVGSIIVNVLMKVIKAGNVQYHYNSIKRD